MIINAWFHANVLLRVKTKKSPDNLVSYILRNFFRNFSPPLSGGSRCVLYYGEASVWAGHDWWSTAVIIRQEMLCNRQPIPQLYKHKRLNLNKTYTGTNITFFNCYTSIRSPNKTVFLLHFSRCLLGFNQDYTTHGSALLICSEPEEDWMNPGQSKSQDQRLTIFHFLSVLLSASFESNSNPY